MKSYVISGASILALVFTSGTALASDIYAGFPITVKDYDGKKKSSVAYTGQIAPVTVHRMQISRLR
jgi:hypothetical protein